ncbi:MAG: RluA family pseudouridine synthase [Bacteroidota bacterium]
MDILYEDNHLLVVHKPAGMPSQDDESKDLSVFQWAKNYIKEKYQKPGNVYVALPHRLDRPTEGVLLLAKTSKAATRISDQFQKRSIQKTYLAITEKIPNPTQGKLTHYVRKLQGKNIMRASLKADPDSKKAELAYEVVVTQGKRALVRVNPSTGRKHQIRVQLASIGSVIKGDMKYGTTSFNADKSICLLAAKLKIVHPTLKEPMEFSVDMPEGNIWAPFNNMNLSF